LQDSDGNGGHKCDKEMVKIDVLEKTAGCLMIILYPLTSEVVWRGEVA
jgi:hypothetical protein